MDLNDVDPWLGDVIEVKGRRGKVCGVEGNKCVIVFYDDPRANHNVHIDDCIVIKPDMPVEFRIGRKRLQGEFQKMKKENDTTSNLDLIYDKIVQHFAPSKELTKEEKEQEAYRRDSKF